MGKGAAANNAAARPVRTEMFNTLQQTGIPDETEHSGAGASEIGFQRFRQVLLVLVENRHQFGVGFSK